MGARVETTPWPRIFEPKLTSTKFPFYYRVKKNIKTKRRLKSQLASKTLSTTSSYLFPFTSQDAFRLFNQFIAISALFNCRRILAIFHEQFM